MDRAATPRPVTRRLAFTLGAIALGVGLLHVVAWQRLAPLLGLGSAVAAPQAPVQVRHLAAPAAPDQAPAPALLPAPRPAPAKTVAAAPPRAEPAPDPAVLVAAALPAPEANLLVAVGDKPVAGRQDDVPVYRTQPPPATTITYDMQQGRWSGTGDLQWRPAHGGYEARLEGKVAGFKVLTWTSQGGFDAAGLAPVRFTDQRMRKSAQAANFQRQAGKITYSGNEAEFPLLQGAQDRLSWMIQIAAVAEADPRRLATGQRVSMFVSGAKGDADVWSFRVEGPEDVSTGDQTVRAVKLLREPRKAHDTRVEVWLAPSLHHLPVQARLTSEGSTLQLRMLSTQPPS
jgi:hypothetical protein